jgi:hypothetical protein
LDFNTDNCEVDIEGYAKVVIHSFIIRSTVSQNCLFDAELKNIACRISRDILILHASREANQAADYFFYLFWKWVWRLEDKLSLEFWIIL